MADVSAHARSFEELRPAVLVRLMEVRASLDHGLARLDDDAARGQLDAVLDHVQAFLATGDRTPLRAFLRGFLAVRAAEGLAAENLLHTVVAIGDVCVQVIHRELGVAPAASELAAALSRATAACTRQVAELIADELARRLAQREQLLDGGAP